MNISEYISDSQVNEIIKIISNACTKYRAYDKKFKNLFYEPYTTMRKKYTVTSAVISAFSPKFCNIDGFTSRDIRYGLHNAMAQPELVSQNVILQIYSNGSDLKGKPIKKQSALHNQSMSNKPIFMIIVFTVNKGGILSNVEIKIPDASGKIIETQTIYEQPQCLEFAM